MFFRFWRIKIKIYAQGVKDCLCTGDWHTPWLRYGGILMDLGVRNENLSRNKIWKKRSVLCFPNLDKKITGLGLWNDLEQIWPELIFGYYFYLWHELWQAHVLGIYFLERRSRQLTVANILEFKIRTEKIETVASLIWYIDSIHQKHRRKRAQQNTTPAPTLEKVFLVYLYFESTIT